MIPRCEMVYCEKMRFVKTSKQTDHPHLVRTEENIQQVSEAFIETPRLEMVSSLAGQEW